jgi:hypothetical protein
MIIRRPTYDDIAADTGTTKARVCQMIALFRRLPSEITDYLMDTDDPETLKFFTERRLRPLTLMATDDDKITRFNEMIEAINTDFRGTISYKCYTLNLNHNKL